MKYSIEELRNKHYGFLERLNEEKNQLEERYTKLSLFISGKGFMSLDEIQQYLLKDQHHHMRMYLSILKYRLSLIEKSVEEKEGRNKVDEEAMQQFSNQLNQNKMTHFQDEGHYQEHMNAQAQAEMEAIMHQAEGEAMAELDSQSECIQEPQQPELTFGERLVGLTFNPSGDDKVTKAKRLCAELADLLSEDALKEQSPLYNVLFNHTIGEILNAQMNVVKVLTLKY